VVSLYTRPSCRSTMRVISSCESGRTRSRRRRDSGTRPEVLGQVAQHVVSSRLRCSSLESAEARSRIMWLPMFEVMMMTVFRKSTVRPCESVRRPSSRDLEQDVKTSWCAFSISVEEHDRVRTAPDRFGEPVHPPRSRRSPEALRSDAPPRASPCTRTCRCAPSRARRRTGTRPAARAVSVFPTPVGPRKMNEPMRPARVLQAGARAPHRVGDRGARLFLADHAGAEQRLQVGQYARARFDHPAHRDCPSTPTPRSRCPRRRPPP